MGVPCLAGLALISYLGNYPEPAAGNRNALGFVMSAGLPLLLSVGVYVMAYRLRLPNEEAQAYVDETVTEAAVEGKELSPPSL